MPKAQKNTTKTKTRQKATTGRKPLGLKTMNCILQIRVTEEVRAAAWAMGGSTWAREILEAALKEVADNGNVELPKAYLKTLTQKKA